MNRTTTTQSRARSLAPTLAAACSALVFTMPAAVRAQSAQPGAPAAPAATTAATAATTSSTTESSAAPTRSPAARDAHAPSLMAQSFGVQIDRNAFESDDPHALRAVSMFALTPPKPRQFQVHDLVQIVVRETSRARSSQELSTEKDWRLNGGVRAFPNFQLADLLNFQLQGGSGNNMPEVRVDMRKRFEGDGEYQRNDDLTARLTAEVIEILPNGNLILQARTLIKNDQEEAVMKVTGICRPDDVTPANTILSNQIHDLKIQRQHSGELKSSSERGIIAKVFDAIFAF